MRGIRAAALLACLGALGCNYDSPGALSTTPEDAPPDSPGNLPTEGYVPACMTADTYAARPDTGRRYRVFSVNVNYDSAIDLCTADGAHLAVVDDLAENAYLQSLIAGGAEAWVGFDDLTEEGMFKWVTGAPGYNHYMAGEPNNTANEDCTAMRTDGRWHDIDCGDNRRPICECAPTYRARPTPVCRSMTANSFERSGRRVLRFDTPATWAQAKSACEAIGAHLLAISDLAENTDMDVQLMTAAYWIGYTDAVQEGVFTWVNGAVSSYRGWPGGNAPLDDNLDCAVIQEGGAWGNVACGDMNRYACECDPAPP